MILLPRKRLIHPQFRTFRDLDEAMRLSNPEDGHSIDLTCDLTVRNSSGKIEGRSSFRCHSFTRQFIDYLLVQSRGGTASAKDWAGNTRTVFGWTNSPYTSYNFYCPGGVRSGVTQWWLGPVVGAGTTAPTINDFQMEKPVPHGTAAANLSAATGTYTSRDYGTAYGPNTFSITHSGKNWTSNQWRGYLLQFTSGAANGLEFPIFWNGTNAVYTFESYGSSFDQYPYCPTAFPPADPGATANYVLKTYGQLLHSNVAFTTPSDDGALQSKFSISRDFTNNQGGAFTISELGLMAVLTSYRDYPSTSTLTWYNYLMIRDVIAGGVVLQNTQVLTVTYNIIVNA